KGGIGTSGATGVIVDRVWIHDTTERAIGVSSQTGPSSITVSASLVEKATDIGVNVDDSQATIEATEVRATRSTGDGGDGWGINIQDSATATVRGCLVDGNHELGIDVLGSAATIEATVVR